QHIFNYLIDFDDKARLVPALAESWHAVDATTWELKLRRGVRFHDGTPFTADDVVFTFERAQNVPNSPASYGQYLKRITETTAVDDYTLRLKTATPYAALLHEIANVGIVSRKIGKDAKTQDYNSGKAAHGTGPYKLVEWVPADRLVLQRNGDYWGEKPRWDRVTIKPITNPASRLAALLAGDVDVINNVPSTDVARLKQNANFNLAQGSSLRVFYISLDSDREVSPFVTDKDGKPLARNPLKDVRVRRAISKAINRDGIVNQIMEGQAIAAGQYLPETFPGTSPKLKPEPYDPEGAKKLLAEAGYPDGFGLTIHGPNDRYPNDAKVVQAVAQMLARVGIKVSVDTMSRTIYFGRYSKLEFSVGFAGTSTDTGEVMDLLKYVTATFDASKGVGAGNRGRYSNARFDQLLEQAYATPEEAKRYPLIIAATELAVGQDVAFVPIYWPVNTWATRKGLAYTPRPEEYTLAQGVRPTP
ncbi:MAG: ABC transporter substrate-binding protein, partial [Alphaproteobacteria bacterium]|nr:ABC transporter substrate-binding protein [Alphaproteobacteria bacterium]